MLAKYNDLFLVLFVSFGLLTAITGVAQYFSGKQVNEALETKIATLEKRQAVRELSGAQLAQLSQELMLIAKPSQAIYLMGLQGNVESIQLAKDLARAFIAAGFKVEGPWEDTVLGGTGQGILVRQGPQDLPKGEAINRALQHVGLASRVVILPDRVTDTIDVIVGYKPPSSSEN